MEPMDIVGKSKEDASLPKGTNINIKITNIFWMLWFDNLNMKLMCFVMQIEGKLRN